MQDIKQDIHHILDIIEYQHDKDNYVSQFIELCQEQALVNVIDKLPEDKKQEFKDKLVYTRDEQKVRDVVTQYMISDEYNKTVSDATKTMLLEFLQTIIPTLRIDQKEKLQGYIEQFTPQPQTTPGI